LLSVFLYTFIFHHFAIHYISVAKRLQNLRSNVGTFFMNSLIQGSSTLQIFENYKHALIRIHFSGFQLSMIFCLLNKLVLRQKNHLKVPSLNHTNRIIWWEISSFNSIKIYLFEKCLLQYATINKSILKGRTTQKIYLENEAFIIFFKPKKSKINFLNFGFSHPTHQYVNSVELFK
jgi:hypothetical protein